jgi:hypothetical protein
VSLMPNLWTRARRPAWVAVGVGVAALAWPIAVPAVAGHEGWATRWPSRLPEVIHLDGRAYTRQGDCVSPRDTPLGRHPVRIGSVPVLFGSAIPILASGARRPGDPAEVAVVVRRDGGCDVEYALQGGP